LLAVADGQSHTAAAQLAGRRHGDTVARWVARFNGEGLAAVAPPWRGSSGPLWCGGTAADPDRAHAVSGPDAGRHGDLVAEHAATALRRAADGLPRVSTHTIGRSLHDAGFGWQKSRTWCETGAVVRKRKRGGPVTVTDPDAAAKRG